MSSSILAAPVLENPNEQQIWLRELVHQLRQPLSTIEACASYLHLAVPEEAGRIHAQLETIEQQVEELNRILVDCMSQTGRDASESAGSRFFTKSQMAGVT